MIGYYVHHVGRGHLHRAQAIMGATDLPVTVLSSLPRPADWRTPWIDLPPDDEDPPFSDPLARGTLHWVPEMNEGLRRRSAELSSWIDHVDPRLMVVDVSVEIAVLARLHGVPVVSVLLAGDRTDPAHRLAHQLSRRLVAAWPKGQHPVDGPSETDERLSTVGAFSRFDDRAAVPQPGNRRALLMCGAGGDDWTMNAVDRVQAQTPGWSWTVLHREHGEWVDDPWPLLQAADVVVTHAGESALAEVAAARRPAVVVPQDRPHDEQHRLARAVAAVGAPVVVRPTIPDSGWADLLEEAQARDGADWTAWSDGLGASRAAAIIADEHDRAR